MPPLDPISDYVSRLEHELRRDPALARRASQEVRQHLEESLERELAAGAPRDAAARLAVERFGPVAEIARQMHPEPAALRALVGLGALGSAGIGAWLVYVVLFVLARRAAPDIPMWACVAVGFLGYGALSAASLQRAWVAPLRWLLGSAAVAGLALGPLAVASQAMRASRGGEFEGYLVLMGVALALHSAVMVAHLVATRPRRFGRA